MTKLPPAMQGHAAMLAFSALIAGSFSLGSLAAPHIEPGPLNTVRFLLAATIATAIAAGTGRLPRGAFRAPWRYAVLGALFVTYFVTMFEALKTVSAVSTSAVFTLTPLIAALLGWALLGQRMTTRMSLALAFGGLGALWVIFRADLDALLSFDIGTGEALFFVGCVAHAIYPTATRLLNRGEPAMAVNAGMLIAGFILLIIYSWPDLRSTNWSDLPMIVWTTIFYTSVFSGVTTLTLLQFASMRLPSGKVMAYTYLVPAWVLVWQMSLGNGLPAPILLVGVVATIIALLALLADE